MYYVQPIGLGASGLTYGEDHARSAASARKRANEFNVLQRPYRILDSDGKVLDLKEVQ